MRTKALAAIALAATLALSACSGADDSSSGPKGGSALVIAKPDGAIPPQNNNPWVADDAALKLGYINALYEPLGIVNLVDPTDEVKPWLAKEIAWNKDYTTLTLTARDGVTWSDGKPFSAEDIAFTFTLLKDKPELDIAALGIKDVATEGDKVTVTFNTSMFVKQDKALHKLIVPKHVWEKVSDPVKEKNLEPVGTGPYSLEKFTSQGVTLAAREDYWGGKPAVPSLNYVSYNDNSALTTALANGEADWAQAALPNVEKLYVDKDPEHNVYWAAAGMGIDALFVNTTKKPFDDPAFRKALNMVIDRDKHAKIAREGGVEALESVTGLPSPAGDAYIPEAMKEQSLEVDVEGAKKVLTEAGYTYSGDTLKDPSGAAVSFSLADPEGWSDYVTGISLIGDSAKELGVKTTLKTPDADSWFADKAAGEFDAVLHWTDTGATPYDLYSDIMDGRWLKPVGEAADYNFGRYDNKDATASLEAYANSTDDATRTKALTEIQEIFVEDVPAMPIAMRPFIGEYNTRTYTGWPGPKDPYANPDPTQPSAVLILTSLKPAS